MSEAKKRKNPLVELVRSILKSAGESNDQRIDIKQLETELQKSAERFKTLFNYSNDAIFIIDPKRQAIVDVNDRACALLGYSRQKLLSTKLTKIYPDQNGAFDKFSASVFKDGHGWTDKIQLVNRKGQKLPTEATAWPLEMDGRILLLTFVHDISARMHTEEALREAEQKFSTLIENMQEGVMIVDNHDVVKFVNSRICQMLGYSEKDILGKVGYKKLFSKKDQKIIQEKNRLRRDNVSDQYEIQMRKKNGENIWVQISGVPMYSGNDGVMGSFGIITDIDKRKLAEKELREARDELEKRVEARTAELLKSNEKLQRQINERKQAEMELKAAEEALQKANDGLEIRVEERTAELSRANEILRKQIKERKRAEMQLLQSEERYRLLFNSGNDAIFVHTVTESEDNTSLIEVNDVLCQKLGYEREGLLKLPLRSISENYSEADVAAKMDKLFREKHILYEDVFLPRTGKPIPVEISAHLFEFNGVPTIMSIARDITARKRAQEQIQEQAALLDKAQDAILVCDLNDYIIYWNKSAERLYGWQTAEAIGTNAFELLFNQDSSQFMGTRRTVLEKGEWQGELRQLTKKGKEIMVESRWTLVHDNNSEAKSILIVNTDVTEKKIIEAQFLRAQRMESIGALAGGIAHDLNNVLAPILTAVQILEVRFTDEKSQRILSTIENNVKRGADMVKQILTFARGVEGERIPLQVQHLIHELKKITLETFPKSIDIQIDMTPDLWTVSGDATQLHQVLLNLCVNARDSMQEGGSLSIKAENAELDEKFVRINLDAMVGDYVVVRVQDTGVGIPDEIINRIFEPFFTTKAPGKGTGLGLSTVIAIVKSHGGFVNVSSKVGEGTLIEVYLPATVDPEYDEVDFVEVDLPSGNGELILVVDDENSILEITQETLETYGYQVVIAHHGLEAVKIYEKRMSEIDLVITDMMMPEMDGITAIAELRKMNPDVKIIASSGFMENERIDEFMKNGVEAFLHKPYTADKLLETLHKYLNQTEKA